MSRKCEKGCNNPFYMARMRAASINDRLASRFSTSELIAISEKRLMLIEKGTANPYPEEILMMSEAYNAPELENYYCSSVCPLRAVPAIDSNRTLSEIAISAYQSLKCSKELQEEMMDIVADGRISEDEKIRVQRVIDALEDITKVKEEWANMLKKCN
ncbi:MAG: XRE family transcriptional regulator [Clostridia bacterium]|nr:XRE family transcriptional regulator [Clostridia bacterium]